jgi:hypothetical protein
MRSVSRIEHAALDTFLVLHPVSFAYVHAWRGTDLRVTLTANETPRVQTNDNAMQGESL